MLVFLDLPPALAQQRELANDTLYVASLVLTTDIVSREPVDTVRGFTTDQEHAYCHVRMFNTYNLREITFRWLLNGQEYYTMGAKISRSPRWRTFSSVKPVPGAWTVQVLDENGAVLKQRNFMVEASR